MITSSLLHIAYIYEVIVSVFSHLDYCVISFGEALHNGFQVGGVLHFEFSSQVRHTSETYLLSKKYKLPNVVVCHDKKYVIESLNSFWTPGLPVGVHSNRPCPSVRPSVRL